MYNLFYYKRFIFYSVITFFIFAVSFISLSNKVNAMKPSCYGYKTIHDKLPSDLQSSEYIYESNGVTLISFATYKDTGNDYKTSIKHSGDTLYYCINYTSHFTPDKTFTNDDSLFSNELRARIALAIHLGASKWNTKANKGYTTGNFVEDYFMTQVVVHSLINKYGGKYKEYGVAFNNIAFKSKTGNLEKKTKALYNACCEAIYSDKTGSFQSTKFSFNPPKDTRLLMNVDGSYIVSDSIGCKIDSNNADILEFNRTSGLYDSNNGMILSDVIENEGNEYNSAYRFNIAVSSLDKLTSGVYTAKIEQQNAFNRTIAKEWKCTDKDFKNNQEVAGISYVEGKSSDSYSLNLIIGNINLKKTDSITGEIISDAEFQVLQYDNTSGTYVFYKNMTFDYNTQKYTSGNLYLSSINPDGKFKVIETKAGDNYINDWKGHEFTIDEKNTTIEIEAENAPILGKLHIHKDGENFKYNESEKKISISDSKISVPKVKFGLYAAENINFKGTLIYQKNQEILEVTTDEKGDAFVNDLIPGKYYIKELETNPLYVLDEAISDFEIVKEDGRYKDVNIDRINKLKNCSINLYKYTTSLNDDSKDENAAKIPVPNCKFGIFALNDITDPNGNIIIKKDTLIKDGITDKDGKLSFKNLLYSDYYMKELEVPDGIILNNEPIIVNKEKYEIIPETTDEYSAKLHIFNSKQKYKINLLKYGEQLSGFEEHESDNGTYFSYLTEYKPLSGVSYSLYNTNKEKLMECQSDSNGIINFEPLEYGNYYCVEESAPETHLIDTTPINISCTTLEPKDKESGIIKVEQSVNDKMYDCTIHIQKLGEKVYVKKGKLKYSYIPLEGVVFGIYQDFDYTVPNGSILPQNTCVGFLTTDSKGYGQFNGKLPEGSYYIRELKTIRGYDLDENLHQFQIKASNNSNVEIDLTNDPYKNYLSKTDVKIIKTDANTGKKLKGVQFTLYNQNKQAIGVYKTNKKGVIVVEDLPYGNYYFLETKALKGYYSSNNQYRFTLDSDETKLLEISNTPILKLGFADNYILVFVALSILIIGGLVIIYRNEYR